MDKETQDVIDEYNEMFATKGWKRYIQSLEDFKRNMEQNSPYKIEDLLRLGEYRGGVQAIDMTLNLEDNINNTAEEIEKEENVEVIDE